jgi:hypothetical protein
MVKILPQTIDHGRIRILHVRASQALAHCTDPTIQFEDTSFSSPAAKPALIWPIWYRLFLGHFLPHALHPVQLSCRLTQALACQMNLRD